MLPQGQTLKCGIRETFQKDNVLKEYEQLQKTNLTFPVGARARAADDIPPMEIVGDDVLLTSAPAPKRLKKNKQTNKQKIVAGAGRQ